MMVSHLDGFCFLVFSLFPMLFVHLRVHCCVLVAADHIPFSKFMQNNLGLETRVEGIDCARFVA